MELVIYFEKRNFHKVREILLKDPVVSLAGLVFRDSRLIEGREGYYCYICGLEEQCKKALELVKELVEEIKNEEKAKIINKIREEERRAIEGFGLIG